MPFSTLTQQPNDPLLQLIHMYAADSRPEKMDLGVGVFRNADGTTPVMAAVKSAEAQLLHTQSSKSYLGPEGDKAFVRCIANTLFDPQSKHYRYAGIQTPGGTGALRLACELLVQSGVKRIFVGTPTWANHNAIFAQVGLKIIAIPCFDLETQSFDRDQFITTLNSAQAGDALLLHGCCHNPLGINPIQQDWHMIANVIARKKLLPLIDLAYHGLGDGWEDDTFGLRTVLDATPNSLITYSCDKNFGLYRERTGALYITTADANVLDCALSNLLALARANWSMPPDHGAAVVRTILSSDTLTTVWREELEAMRQRIVSLRKNLAQLGTIGSIDLTPIARGKGMFTTLPLTPAQVTWLRDHHAIYMAPSGRINIAGFKDGEITRFGEALRLLEKHNALESALV